MNDLTPLMTRYLFDELSEREREELEARYFDDPRMFRELSDIEDALVDDYVRDRLRPEVRRRFESSYLSTPERRARVQFARALVTTVDQRHVSDLRDGAAAQERGWLAWLGAWRGPQLVMATVTVAVLIAAGGWFFIGTERTRLDTVSTGSTGDTARPPDVAPPSVRDTPAAPVPSANATSPTPPAPPTRPVLAIVTLALTVGPGERSVDTGALPTLTIPPGTEQVRLALTLREHDYARYRVSVRTISGSEVLRQGNLIPASGRDTPAFELTIPADRVAPGDYMLTLEGASATGEFENLSQTLFRVRQP